MYRSSIQREKFTTEILKGWDNPEQLYVMTFSENDDNIWQIDK